MAEVLLFAVGGLAVLEDVFTVAVVADDDLSNHSWILSFGSDPLPTRRLYAQSGGAANEQHNFTHKGLRGAGCEPSYRDILFQKTVLYDGRCAGDNSYDGPL